MPDPTKAETDAVFKILKSQKANKVRIFLCFAEKSERLSDFSLFNLFRYALIVRRGTQHGRVSRLGFTSVWIVLLSIEEWVFISVSVGTFE